MRRCGKWAVNDKQVARRGQIYRNILILNDFHNGGGGSRTPVRKAQRLEDYMLISFATDFAYDPQERAITNRRLACSPDESGSRPTASDGDRRTSPLNDASPRTAGRTEETRYLIRQRKQTACWQLCVPRRLRVVWTPGMPSKRECFRRNRNAPTFKPK